jgi:homogentisate 1,2-dioxygenase
MIFIHKGSGKLRTMMGNITFEYGDYLIIPGIIYQIEWYPRMIVLCESFAPLYTKTLKNESGQFRASPFCERDFILPMSWNTRWKKGDFTKIKKEGMMHE